jgi:putative ABC transport system permease protein
VLAVSRWRIYRWLLSQTAAVVVTGTVAGLLVARWVARFVTTLLFEISAGDPASYALAGGVLLIVAMSASVLAGRRAVHIDPTKALRYE